MEFYKIGVELQDDLMFSSASWRAISQALSVVIIHWLLNYGWISIFLL
jgi:hypothetical protein